jgi:ribosomal protein RSM22 (predicted rRNA methylase)
LSLTLSKILPHLLFQFKSESDLVRATHELSSIFNHQRDRLPEYGKDARLVSAYTAFYALTNIPKLEATLKWFSEDVIKDWESIELVDVGAGPGTMSLAWMELFPKTKEIYQIEQSQLMKEQSAKIFAAIYPEVKLRFSGNQKSEKKRIALFGHSLNEMGVEIGMRMIRDLDPDYILFIEPGMLTVFPQMLEMREKLLSEYSILFPCLGQGDCPLKNNNQDWCHQYLHVKQTDEVERLTQLASKDRRHLPITVHLYSKESKTLEVNHKARVFRTLPETKFSLEMQVCVEEKESLLLKHFQIYKKHYSKKEQKDLEQILAGDLVDYEVEKELPEYSRVKIKKA